VADDPPAVLGDAGGLYVSADIIPIYKELLHYSSIITPNWFEVEYVQGPSSGVHFH
jgi:pyridoxal/pyridoxine/pyridoxamine kinase